MITKPIISDSREVFVHYNAGKDYIFGAWTLCAYPLASIDQVVEHYEIWDSPLIVKEGKFVYKNGEYVKV